MVGTDRVWWKRIGYGGNGRELVMNVTVAAV